MHSPPSTPSDDEMPDLEPVDGGSEGSAAAWWCNDFKVGDHVVLKGLRSRPEWNGYKAKVRGPAQAGRIEVQLLGRKGTLSVKPDNLERPTDGNAGDRGDAGDAGGEGGVAPAVDMAKLAEDAKKAEQELLASLEADESSKKKKKGGKKKKKKGGGGAAKGGGGGGGDDAANEDDAKPAAAVEPELPEVDDSDSDDEEARAQRLESQARRIDDPAAVRAETVAREQVVENDAPAAYTDEVRALVAMGFDAAAATNALHRHHGDIDLAANDLVLTGDLSAARADPSPPPPAAASAKSLEFGSAKSFEPPPQATPMPPQPPAAAATAKPAAKSPPPPPPPPPPAAAASASASAKSDPTLLDLLTDLGLQQHLPKFEAEEIDMETLEMCEPEELSTLLEDLKLTMGPRKKIQKHFAALHAGAGAAAAAPARPPKTVDDVDSLNAQMDAAALRQEALERELHAQTAELTAHRNECERLRDTMRARGVVPRHFECPICMEVMYDPVSAADGHTYERGEMERWLETNTTSPSTGAQLENTTLTPNHLVRSMIREYMDSMRAAEGARAAAR